MKKMSVVMMAAITVLSFVSCDSGGSDPERVYLTGSDTFTRVDAAGNLEIAAIYQYDGEGDFYTGEDVPVTFDASSSDFWTVTVDGKIYLADKWIGVTFIGDNAEHSTFEYTVVDGVVMAKGTSITYMKLVTAGITYLGNGQFTFPSGITYTAP